MPRPRDPIRDFPGKRWLNVVLRTVHLVGIVLFGAALLGAGSLPLGATVIVASGLSMLALDTWSKPAHLREIAGFGVLVKLGLIALASALPQMALPAFWTLVVFSTLLAHAPGRVRHRRLF
ncbi:hypothetical protein LZ012_10465 [Dechloromonas sp. XY25]|uniref:ATP synthase subunit I n=1 Tax=Dechloromonas hankyongensis TaxID=2908002 RepID=A0ABS9K2Z0_9RHOO|nr:hypothetical protein [Dechloromonas hankyongensis]MCG2577415.1 hypothetical protein [Dechloromonas hankyongensis]